MPKIIIKWPSTQSVPMIHEQKLPNEHLKYSTVIFMSVFLIRYLYSSDDNVY